MLQYFLFAGSKPFFINIRENANIDFAPIFGSLFLFSAGCVPIFGSANTGQKMFVSM